MSNTIGLNVNIKSELGKLSTFRDEAAQKGAFKGPGGQEALTRIDGLLRVIESLTKTGKVAEEDWNKVVSSVKTVYSELSQFSAKVSKLSPEMEKLYQGLREKEQQINEWSKKKVAATEGRTEVGSKMKKLAETEGISFHKVTKKGNVGQNLTDPGTILKNYQQGTLALKNKDGQEIRDQQTINNYLQSLSTEYQKHTQDLDTANTKIKEFSASIDQINQKIKTQTAKETSMPGGSSGSTLVADVETSSHNFNKEVNKIAEDNATKKENDTKVGTGDPKLAAQATKGWSGAFKAISLYTMGVRALRTAVRSAAKTVSELDKYLTEQAMVTGKSRKETYGMLQSYQALASQCGATTKEIAQVSTEYLKQGKSMQEALVLTEAAVKAAKVARVSVGDSVNYLTTALNGFQLEASEAMAVSDKFAAVAAASATDYDELAIALSKVASQANLAGMSIDYTTALLTKGLETTREAPETMGTALKTIIARMRELGDYGETLDDGMDINNVESQLKYVGIALRDSNGELRSTEDVLDELGHKWDSLNKNQQAAIAKALAGTRQQARLIAMMEDYERVTELQEISARSAGATSAQADTYLEGMEAAINNVKVAWEKVAMSFTDSEAIIWIVERAADALQIVSDILDTTAGQVGVFGTIAALGVTIVGNKMQEHAYAKEQQRIEKERALADTQKEKADAQARVQKAEDAIAQAKIDSDARIEKLKADGNDQVTALGEKRIQLEKLKVQAQQTREKHVQAVTDAEANISQLELNKKLQEELIKEKEKTKEDLLQLALQKEAEGDKAASDRLMNQASDAEKEWNQAKADYNSANYDAEIKKNKDIARANKGQITKDDQKIAAIDKDIQGTTAEIQTVKNNTVQQIQDEAAATNELIQQQSEILNSSKQQVDLLSQQESLLESQLDPIKAITSGLTGWLTPISSFAKGIGRLGKSFGKLKKKFDTSRQSKANAKALKQEEKARKKNEKAAKKEQRAAKRSEQAKKKEAQAARQVTQAETGEAAQNIIGATTDTLEAEASDRAADKDKQEITASAGAAGAETIESGANIAGAATERAEDQASDASAASDVKEAGTSINAAAADAVESTGNTVNAITGSAESASKIPYVGWAIALGILALAGVAAGFAIANMNGAFDNEKGAEKKAENINNLSGEIYKLTERARALDQITDSFDAIDEKVIKTKKDMEEMNSLLEKAGDELSDEIEDDEDIGYGEGVSAKEAYEQLSRQEDKINFLKAEADRNRQLANAKRREQLEIFNNARSYEKNRLLHGTEAQYVAARSAIYGINNNTLYEHVDALKAVEGADAEALAATEELVQSMLNELDVETALAIANEENGETIKELAGRMADMPAAEDFLNEDKSILERVNAYKELSGALAGNKEMLNALKAAYSEWDTFSQMDESILQFIDTMGLSIDQLNELYAGYKNLQKLGLDITKDQYQDKIDLMMMQMDGDLSNFEQVIKNTFGDVLADAEDFDEAWNTIVSSIGDTFATGILDMGQNMEKFKNTINSFYEKAAEWGELSESEKMEFITDNQDLFSGENGAEMLQAFKSGNYAAIEEALSKQLDEKTQAQLEDVRRTLAVEEARVGEDRNEAYIASLKEYEEYLMDGNDLYKASLEFRLDQEQKQLDEYKEYLEKQREAEEESLNKRKEAYEKYFDALAEEEEDAEYEAQAELLERNLSKLGSSDSAEAKKMTKEMEQELEDLNEERMKELRERAQEAILENMDDQLEEISEKFDKLLENNQALLAAMRGDLENPEEYIGNLISNKVESGATAFELEEYLGNLQSTYGSGFKDGDLNDIKIREENNQMFLTVNGKDIMLDTQNEQNLYAAIIKALREIGLR